MTGFGLLGTSNSPDNPPDEAPEEEGNFKGDGE